MVQNIPKEHQELLIQKQRHHNPENCNFQNITSLEPYLSLESSTF